MPGLNGLARKETLESSPAYVAKVEELFPALPFQADQVANSVQSALAVDTAIPNCSNCGQNFTSTRILQRRLYMIRWFLADAHFEEEAIIKMMARVSALGRLFSSAEEHDAHIMAQINRYVGRDDEFYIVGDWTRKNPGKFRAMVQCRHVRFVLGNHDPVQKCANVFGPLTERLRTKAFSRDGKDYVKLVVDHYPGAYWDGSHNGWCNVYGHIHSQREAYLDEVFPGRRGLDVGVDNAYRLFGEYRPFSEHDVYDYMARREGHDDLRFYRDFQIGLYMERGLL